MFNVNFVFLTSIKTVSFFPADFRRLVFQTSYFKLPLKRSALFRHVQYKFPTSNFVLLTSYFVFPSNRSQGDSDHIFKRFFPVSGR